MTGNYISNSSVMLCVGVCMCVFVLDWVTQMYFRIEIQAPIAQLVESWTPGSESPGSRRSGARYMKLLTGMARLVGAAAAS